jgi:hypothetical protein
MLVWENTLLYFTKISAMKKKKRFYKINQVQKACQFNVLAYFDRTFVPKKKEA